MNPTHLSTCRTCRMIPCIHPSYMVTPPNGGTMNHDFIHALTSCFPFIHSFNTLLHLKKNVDEFLSRRHNKIENLIHAFFKGLRKQECFFLNVFFFLNPLLD
jgi:hypothetical protein